ncbi:MAG TPA: hypothetical protein VFO89_11285 [Thermoanaerobaculia bacterium]|nr:hypothetical protein [Thermoanaerobaculia bacterium]
MLRSEATSPADLDELGSKSVFINVPFDVSYEPLFVTLVGALTYLGHTPRCVLEVQETGQGRLARIFGLIGSCRMSFHDVSRVGTPARFNMPFELGLACAVSLSGAKHDIIVMDAKPYRLDRILSDYKGRDPLIHYGRCDDLVTAVLDVFAAKALPPVRDVVDATQHLRRAAGHLKQDFRSATVFRPTIFRSLFAAATEIGRTRGFIA